MDAAGNVSAASAAAGRPLAADPRKDPIYFVLTARFNDGESSNNRVGSQHEKSRNAANGDLVFRVDLKGLVDELDHIKGLGFSTVWNTPVVLAEPGACFRRRPPRRPGRTPGRSPNHCRRLRCGGRGRRVP